MYKVLIVDDEQLIREGISDGIDWCNIKCEIPITAENGIEAIKIIEKQHIDIVITDIKMPGINGLELSKFIHEKYKSIKIIILSGYADFQFAQNALRYGVIDFILKPTKLEEIEDSILRIDKLFSEEESKNLLINEAEKNIYKIDIYNKTQLIEKLIFGYSENSTELKEKFIRLKFQPEFYQLCIMEFKTSNKIECYIENIESKISGLINNYNLEYISFTKDQYLIFFFSSNSNKFNKSSFYTITNNMIMDISKEAREYLPFNLFVGMSYIDADILNARNLYYDALKKLDTEEKKRLIIEGNDPIYDLNIEDIFKLRFKTSILNKDIPKICEDVDDLFDKLELYDLTYIKNISINLVNYCITQINQLSKTKNIFVEKSYSNIIISLDKVAIKSMLKKAIRDAISNDDIIFKENSELKERLIEYIRINYSKKVKIEEVAEHFYISPGHLSRVLKKGFGKTFVDILTEIRIENAEIFLKNHNYKTYEVASAVGFSDPKYFSQVFKKYTGKTPSDFK